MFGVFSKPIRVVGLALFVSRLARALILGEGFRYWDLRRDYNDLGRLLASIARARMRPPAYADENRPLEDSIASRVEERTGQRFKRQEIREYLRGSRQPSPRFIPAFAETYSLTVKERRMLAWAHAFSEQPHPRTMETPPPAGE